MTVGCHAMDQPCHLFLEMSYHLNEKLFQKYIFTTYNLPDKYCLIQMWHDNYFIYLPDQNIQCKHILHFGLDLQTVDYF